MNLPTFYGARAFKERLKYLVLNDPSAYRIAHVIRESRNASVEEQIEDVFWAFSQPSVRHLLDTLAEQPGGDHRMD